MALTAPAKACLWRALSALRRRDYAAARKCIEDALVFLELTPDAIDPGLKLK